MSADEVSSRGKLKMKIIGLTGGIASGKSTVTEFLRKKGYIVIDCDKIAWDLAEPDGLIWQIYFSRYGSRVINNDRSLNRQAVADIVFKDKKELQAINSLVHPVIKDEMLFQIKKAEAAGRKIVFLDVPLLFESGFDKIADEKWLVYTSYDIQLKRLMARNGYTEQEAVRRIASQMSLEDKKEHCDVVILNDKDRNNLYRQINDKLNELDIEGY